MVVLGVEKVVVLVAAMAVAMAVAMGEAMVVGMVEVMVEVMAVVMAVEMEMAAGEEVVVEIGIHNHFFCSILSDLLVSRNFENIFLHRLNRYMSFLEPNFYQG